MIDGCDHSALLEEALAHVAVAEELRSDRLERDSPPEHQVLCQVDGAHSAAPEETLDAVGPDLGPGLHSWIVRPRFFAGRLVPR